MLTNGMLGETEETTQQYLQKSHILQQKYHKILLILGQFKSINQ